jgi:Fe-S-cluster-containing dehydrogenase component/DMSO reductase anchor subunit
MVEGRVSVAQDLSPRTLIDELLAEQRRLTPVERFARKHDGGQVPAQERYYRDLIPQTKPTAGEQYAFSVDLDACTGCKACVSACHSLNGLEENEVWRNVGLIHGGSPEEPYQQTVTTACHHCVEPGCLEGCPVMAYEKDEETGIVRHLDDQCIGCQYCVLKCPYDVPKYSERLGIVRKCDMCIDRLAVGEAPACVQACPHEAISIRLVDRAALVRELAPGTRMLPGAFDSNYTKPTTHFLSRRDTPMNARAANSDELRLEHGHWPLVLMLLLTQTAVGLFVTVAVAALAHTSMDVVQVLSVAGWLTLHVGLGASVLHLGRPLGAWRFFLGLRTSWMSREILAFAILGGVATVSAIAVWVSPLKDLVPMLAIATALLGGIGVFTSAMIYVDTRRDFWSARLTFPKFFGTALLLGTTTASAVLSLFHTAGDAVRVSAIAAMIIRASLFYWEAQNVVGASQRIVARFLPWLPGTRVALFVVSSLAGFAAIVFTHPVAAVLAFASTFASQVLERYCFFAACPTPRMPGGVPT